MNNTVPPRDVCHAFYVGTGNFTLIHTPKLRVDIIEVVNFVPTALFFLWLVVTLPCAVNRFCRGRKGQTTGIVTYFILIWLTALFRSLRFLILWLFMRGDAPAHLTVLESVMYMFYLSVALTVEACFLVCGRIDAHLPDSRDLIYLQC